MHLDKNYYWISVGSIKANVALFFSLQATDKDAGNYGEIGYILSDGNIGDTFSIEPSRYHPPL